MWGTFMRKGQCNADDLYVYCMQTAALAGCNTVSPFGGEEVASVTETLLRRITAVNIAINGHNSQGPQS